MMNPFEMIKSTHPNSNVTLLELLKSKYFWGIVVFWMLVILSIMSVGFFIGYIYK